MAKLFEDILTEAALKGILPDKSKQSSSWFRERAKEVEKAEPDSIINSTESKLVNRFTIGRMYLYSYLPKHKDKLKYYDIFPLVFPFEKKENGFLGLNLHYLPLNYRALLMDSLYNLTDKTFDANTKLKLTYEILTSTSKLKYYKPCVKHYLNSQLRSRYVFIPATQWDIALFLPLERFQKVNKQQVFKDSRKIIRGN